jgi:hypothetical protein
VSLRIPQPSKRFIRAAAGERDDLIAHRSRLEDDRARLLVELRHVDDALSSVDERLRTLDSLLGAARPGEADDRDRPAEREDGDGRPSARPSARSPARLPDAPAEAIESPEVLAGPRIREVAVQAVLQQPDYIEALHYRRWYDLLRDVGYSVAGKDPLAVFLTQITRSPVIRKGTKPGVYELDRQAPLRLRQRLERLRAELREVTSGALPESEFGTLRARRHEIDQLIGQTERALEEALRVLRRDDGEAPSATVRLSRRDPPLDAPDRPPETRRRAL